METPSPEDAHQGGPTLGHPNLGRDLKRIHMVIARGLHVATEAGDIYAHEGYPDDTMRLGFRRYVTALLALLEAHFGGEDELVWPFLRDLLPDAPFGQLTVEHREMGKAIKAARASLEAQDRGLNLHLHRLQDQWEEHRSLEEMTFSEEVMQEAVTPGTQEEVARQLAAHLQSHSSRPALVIPFILYNLPPEERAAMQQAIPAVVIDELVPGPWRDQWAPMMPFLLM